MYLKNLKLTNFRNFSKLDLDLDRITLLIGDNAQGKSNLLESIYFLATTKSPRAEKDIELVKEEEDFTRVEGEVGEEQSSVVSRQSSDDSLSVVSQSVAERPKTEKPNPENRKPITDYYTKLEIGMQKRQDGLEGLEKKVKVNGISRRTLDYIGNLIVIYFSPEDINLVTGPPSLRRWHIDLTLAQVDREYKNALTSYHQAIIAKNRLLKKIREGLAQVPELEYWTDTALGSGQIVSAKRRVFFETLNKEVNHKEFSFIYHENVLSAERLEKYLPREIAASASLIGPHRDDFDFVVLSERSESKDHINRNLAQFGSRGEQRTAVLQLKMSELKFIKGLKGVMPILLLDDVFSELDDNHRHFVTSVINGQQTILSAVEETQVPKEFLEIVKVVRVEQGTICALQNGKRAGRAGK
ncbi:hypothetical protein A3A14_02420 [Candidatus Daviesbacteria bacterium RIFCSPLOWO2_01_FULL_43_38]|uniref:DNA replication and repair protein RecF n=1 Tax=Candidatus Daviesbacteria bacterium RIFCSPHIGHO2_12_FULL_43_11 TaxID=1797780 RepID=A0A1F5K1Z8_9BACT|nr:MAG: hypothetical protein A2874_01825 [Candidatus Daviesbacteria bacterium RIFCSPHIGHO2_01_FULL_43_17]OGE34810.1 MAG: hypothetical protein A3E45_02440 [Candidatus Daviesbacteria bacterium RIFCSPHIGHO2_12_FULL_43_11]OGE64019.1 MAG: hypothetical protein A3A14_02420 [Candidatus Daviesbacteria bacterium RIFCSPLOWO2_01_FULL_43_38]OGE69162.1 MAG: hypothetical protein A3J21_02025 [Candidatus Daviesbacteria bacterium RIFCSPLOWO2_02_FULL_43_11]